MAESAEAVVAELAAFLSAEVVSTVMALGSLRTLAAQVVSALEGTSLAPGESMLVGHSVPDVGWILRFDNVKAARLHAADVAPDGATSRRLTQRLIVSLDTAWEHGFRGRLAAARGLEGPRAVACDFFRDLRRLRNDVVHHHGVATGKNAGRCTVFRRTFAIGDVIYFDDVDLLNLKYDVPWGDLGGVLEH